MWPFGAAADSNPAVPATHVVISELQTGTTASASQEFVELYNPTSTDLNLTGWTLEYKSATSADQPSSWSKRVTLTKVIKASGFYLLAPKIYLLQADDDMSSGLAGSGGLVRLKDSNGTVVDELGWGAANVSETTPAPAPAAGQSLERLPGRLDEVAGNWTDTDNNNLDFVLRDVPNPQTSSSVIEVPTAASTDSTDATNDSSAGSGSSSTDPAVPPSTDPSSDQPGSPAPDSPVVDQAPDDTALAATVYLPIQITELLVNPASPQTDAADEFIELYNPNSQTVNLAGYTLRTGSNFHDFYVIPNIVIDSGGYLALYSSQTRLSLTNTGGAAELLDPLGAPVDVTANYSTASDGQGWDLIDGQWQWSLDLTPGQPNVLASPVAKTVAKAAATKTSTAKKVSAAKVKKAKAKPKAKTTKAKAASASGAAADSTSVTTASSPSSKWLILGALALTMGYGLWEYRHDLQNRFELFRRHSKTRGKDRSPA